MSVAAGTTLSEAASKELLGRYGVPIADERLTDTADDAAAAAEELGFPVVAKLCGDAIAHKTERGLVRLNLGDATAVRAAAADLLAAATPADGAVQVLVARKVDGAGGSAAEQSFDPVPRHDRTCWHFGAHIVVILNSGRERFGRSSG